MKKIKTIFDRDWNGNRGVIDCLVEPIYEELVKAKATEKLDGTNIRVTLRNEMVVRVEKRRNPSKLQKAKGISEPWYVDADENDPGDKYIFEGLKDYGDFNGQPNGEWSGEVLGPKVQGNPLNLPNHTVCFFTLDEAPVFEDAPINYEQLKEWLPKQESKFGNGKIEGIVWHCEDGTMYKIKTKDFK